MSTELYDVVKCSGSKERIQHLLNDGADIDFKNPSDNHNTVLHVAARNCNPIIVKLLLEKKPTITQNDYGQTPLAIAKLTAPDDKQGIMSMIKNYSSGSHIGLEPLQQDLADNASHDNNILVTRNNNLPITIEQKELTYDKEKGANGIHGHLYESKLTSLILLRATYDHEIKNFHLATNVKDMNPIDDIIFRLDFEGQENPCVTFIQTKHRINTEKNKLTVEDVLNEREELYLGKYFAKYLQIREKYVSAKKNSDVNNNDVDPIFKNDFQDIDCNFIIYTTTEEDFKKKVIREPTCTKITNLLLSSGTGQIFQFNYELSDIDALADISAKQQIKQLAVTFAKYITQNETKYHSMMSDPLIEKYNMFLSHKIINVSRDITKNKNKKLRYGNFTNFFFDSNDHLITTLRQELYKELVKTDLYKSKHSREDLWDLIKKIIDKPSEVNIAKLIGHTLKFNYEDNVLDLIDNDLDKTPHHSQIRNDLKNIYISPSVVTAAVELAGREKLQSLRLNLPPTFGHQYLLSKNKKKIDHITHKLIELLNQADPDTNIININESSMGPGKLLDWTDLKINGGIGSLVGDLLISGEENSLKFNDENLSPYAKKIFTELEKNHIIFKKLFKYKFNVNVQSFPRLTLEANESDKTLVKEFLNKLYFFTNQSKEHEIEIILNTEIKKIITHYKNLNDQLVRNILDFDVITIMFHAEVQRWWMQSHKAPYLTKTCDFLTKFLVYVKHNNLLSLNFIYTNYMKPVNELIKFTSDAIQSLQIDKFLACNELIMKIVTEGNLLSAVKLDQYLKQRNDVKYIFIDLNYSIQNGCYDEIIPEIQSLVLDILIIDCNKADNIELLCMKLENLIVNCNVKKIFILVEHNLNKKIEHHLRNKHHYIEKIDVRTTLLDTESHKELLNRKIEFHGEKITLHKVVGEEKHLVNACLIQKLVNNELIKIGDSITNFSFKKYVINDITTNSIKIRDEFTDNRQRLSVEQFKQLGFVVLFNNKIDIHVNNSPDDIILISNNPEHFRKICSEASMPCKNINIHYFKKQSSKFIWLGSKGHIGKLHRCAEREIQPLHTEFERDVDVNLVTIYNSKPSNGIPILKTHLLFTEGIDTCHWIVKINLSSIYRLQRNKIIDIKCVLTFILQASKLAVFADKNCLSFIYPKNSELHLRDSMNTMVNGEELFKLQLFLYYYNQGKVAILCDIVKHADSQFKQFVWQFVTILKKTKIESIWLTEYLMKQK